MDSRPSRQHAPRVPKSFSWTSVCPAWTATGSPSSSAKKKAAKTRCSSRFQAMVRSRTVAVPLKPDLTITSSSRSTTSACSPFLPGRNPSPETSWNTSASLTLPADDSQGRVGCWHDVSRGKESPPVGPRPISRLLLSARTHIKEKLQDQLGEDSHWAVLGRKAAAQLNMARTPSSCHELFD